MVKEIERVEQYVNLDFGSDYVQMCYSNFDIDDICNAIYCNDNIEEVRKEMLERYEKDVCIEDGDYIEYNEEALKEVIRLDAYLLLNCCPKAHDRIEEQYHNDLMEQYYERD